MGFVNWFRRLFGGQGPSEVVPFYDVPSRKVVRIPIRELRPGAVQARVQGIEELVWLLPDQLQQGPIRHPPFDEGIRDYIRQIHRAFAEHRSLSFEEWEEGFRRDANPEREIALWSHAGDVYQTFAANESSPERRKDLYHVIVACLTASPDTVWHVIQLSVLERPEAEQVVNRFYGKRGSDG